MKIIYNDGHVDECPADDELHVIRHTAAHILAQAVKHLYPQENPLTAYMHVSAGAFRLWPGN